ncbi:lysophospholipid acyltransferase family protein [Demequina pelophila]|uniref:lysophospholipid acyltransferase family protein n=1 Tax=Demequina pelophila TaxID=1638984 RepID=UPI000AF4FE6B|nr:lysophospholipid acyltransferase family protein [Demequina pelophila]
MSVPAAPSPWGPRWSRWLGVFLAKVLWRTEVRGGRSFPRRGAVIVVCNHVGLIDGPVLHGVIPRPSHFLIREGMMTGPLGALLTAAQQIKVSGSGREALAQGLAVLRRGGVVGVFPEGTRGAGTAEAVHGGAAWLAVQSGATVVPAAIIGSRRTGERVSVWPRPGRRLLVAFGEPLDVTPPPDVRGGRAKQAWAAARLGEALRDQVARTLESTDLELPLDDPRRDGASQKEIR